MNVLPADEPIDPRLWERPHMRAALARHDISEVYQLLAASGVSQRRIAALTGQNQSEISDINQGRQVQAYDLLARIADGLGIPRGYMGLAYTDITTRRLATPRAPRRMTGWNAGPFWAWSANSSWAPRSPRPSSTSSPRHPGTHPCPRTSAPPTSPKSKP
ncbi:hypothetical protein GCM10029964_061160 [Kibdelosporangium lantanae]